MEQQQQQQQQPYSKWLNWKPINEKQRKGNEMITQTQLITPEIAKAYLQSNINNRTVRPTTVTILSDVIKRGAWKLTHQGIAFGEDGSLLDGQHRLMAIAESGIPVEMNVTRGVSEKVFDVIDIGCKRSYGDLMRCSAPVAQTCSFAANILYYRHGRPPVDIVEKILVNIGDLAVQLTEFAPTKQRYFSSSPSRFAAVLRMAENKTSKDYVMLLYKNLVESNFSGMEPAGITILQQVARANVDIHDKYDTLARMWSVFDIKKRNITNIRVDDKSNILKEIREVYIKVFGWESWMAPRKKTQ